MAIVELERVTKEYRLGQLQSVREAARRSIARMRGERIEPKAPFRALDDLSLRIEQGEVVGVIGHNGAGKSTLLKLLSRITVPTAGSVNVRGRVAPLIEVGAGLVGDMTGRENIYLNGAVLGMSRAEIRRKFDDIVAFAELERFIDTPLKRYSSGMQIRLGFSVATAVNAEILLLDEVLAVGDMAFQRKCLDRVDQLINSDGRTVIIVGHNIRQIERLCTRTIMLERGRLVMDGLPGDVCGAFLKATQDRVNAEHLKRLGKVSADITTGQIEVESVEVCSGSGEVMGDRPLAPHQPISIRSTVRALEAMDRAELVLGIHTPDLLYVTQVSTAGKAVVSLGVGVNTFDCRFEANILRPGVYGVGLMAFDRFGRCIWRGDNLRPFVVGSAAETIAGAGHIRCLVDMSCSWTITPPATDASRDLQVASGEAL